MNQAKKKLCPACQKRRDANFFEPRARICVICKEVKKKSVVKVSLPELKRQAQKYFNAYIRLRDKDLPCISCGATTARAWHAGHYWAQGMNGYLRFHQENVNKQCDSCNVWKHGNLLNYRLGLIEKWGEDKAKWLDENHNKTHKYTREELEAIISKYKQLTETK